MICLSFVSGLAFTDLPVKCFIDHKINNLSIHDTQHISSNLSIHAFQ